jgi:hypothetical protein
MVDLLDCVRCLPDCRVLFGYDSLLVSHPSIPSHSEVVRCEVASDAAVSFHRHASKADTLAIPFFLPRRFPFYYTFKCAFIVWLMLPSTRVSENSHDFTACNISALKQVLMCSVSCSTGCRSHLPESRQACFLKLGLQAFCRFYRDKLCPNHCFAHSISSSLSLLRVQSLQ